MHKIENDTGPSTDVLKLIFYTFSFFSSTMLKAARQEDVGLQRILFLIEK